MSVEEKLALASEISDEFEGKAIALIKGKDIAIDELTADAVCVDSLLPVVRDFIARRKQAEHYSVEVDQDRIKVHSTDPVAASRGRGQNGLPPNLRQCPYCAFITQYEEEYTVHVRSHLFGV